MTATITRPEETPLQARIDEALARQRPFANSTYIKQQFHASYKRRLIKMSDEVPAARELVRALDRLDGTVIADRILSDTAVRSVIDHVRRRVLLGSAAAHKLIPASVSDELLTAAASFADSGEGSRPLNLSDEPRLGSASYHPWIWRDNRLPDDPFMAAYQWLIEAHYGGMPMTADDDMVAALRTGARLLETLLPQSAPSVLAHTQTIAVIPAAGVWERMQSSSQYLLGGNIFLSELVLDKSWLVAELLYHESIHQKLYDLRHGHTILGEDSVLDPDAVLQSDVLVKAPWNYPDNEWDTHRTLAAFHVYVHVTHFCMTADERAADLADAYGSRQGMTPTKAALDRARYLGDRLQEPGCWHELGEAGRKLVEWLLSILQAMDNDPAPPGADLHLYLDRYEREAARVLKRPDPGEVIYQAELLGADEVVVATDLLERMGRHDAAEKVLADVHGLSSSGSPLDRFAQTRRIVATSLRDCSDRGYALLAAPGLGSDQVVRRMVERSSRLLAVGREINELEGPSVHDLLLDRRSVAM